MGSGFKVSALWFNIGSCKNKEDVVSFIDPRMGGTSRSEKSAIWHSIKNDVEINEITWNYPGDLFFMTTGQGMYRKVGEAERTRGMPSETRAKRAKKTKNKKKAARSAFLFFCAKRFFLLRGAQPFYSEWSKGFLSGVGMLGQWFIAILTICTPPLYPTGTVRVLEFPSFKPAVELNAHTANIYCVEFDPKGRYFATGSADALICLWDIDEFLCVRTFGALEWPIRTISFSYDGELIASGSEDRIIDISAVETGERIHTIQCSAAMNSVAWHPSKHFLAYAGDDVQKDYKTPEGNLRVFGVGSAV